MFAEESRYGGPELVYLAQKNTAPQIIIYILATIFLIFMLFTLEGYISTEPEESDDLSARRVLRALIEIPSKITDAIELSINDWGIIYDWISYIFCGINVSLYI